MAYWPIPANILNNGNSSIYVITHVTMKAMTFFHFLLLSKKNTSKYAAKISLTIRLGGIIDVFNFVD